MSEREKEREGGTEGGKVCVIILNIIHESDVYLMMYYHRS